MTLSTLKRRILIAGALLAALLCLVPARTNAPAATDEPGVGCDPAAPMTRTDTTRSNGGATPGPDFPARPAGADLSARTEAGCMLHRTMIYAPCGHSTQRREALDGRLIGLSHAALEKEIGGVYPGAAVTAFDAKEVDVTMRMDIPCPLHWVLAAGEDGMLAVMQNRMGDCLSLVRTTDVPNDSVPEDDRDDVSRGKVFDDVQALEGYLESLSS